MSATGAVRGSAIASSFTFATDKTSRSSRRPPAAGPGDAGALRLLVRAEHAYLHELVVEQEAGADEPGAGEADVLAKTGRGRPGDFPVAVSTGQRPVPSRDYMTGLRSDAWYAVILSYGDR